MGRKSSKPIRSSYPRTRERTRDVFLTRNSYRQWYVTKPGGVTTTTSSGEYLSSDPSTEVMNDIVTPGFSQRSAGGDLVNNPMSKVSVSYELIGDVPFSAGYSTTSKDYYWTMSSFPRSHVGRLMPYEAPRLIDVANLQYLARTEALSGIGQPDVQGLVELVEAEKTLKMLINPLNGLARIIKSRIQAIKRMRQYAKTYARKHKIPLSEAEGILAKRWGKSVDLFGPLADLPVGVVLGYNLGLRPLMMTIGSVHNKLPNVLVPEWKTARSRKETTQRSSEVVVAPIPSSGINATWRYTYTEIVSVRAGVVWTTKGGGFSTKLGIRLIDVPEAAWELVPLSFLIDYVINIGDILGALRGYATSVIANTFTTTVVSITVERECLGWAMPLPYVCTSGLPGKARTTVIKTDRSPDPFRIGLAYQPLNIGFKAPSRVQNVLALVTKMLLTLRHPA